MKKLKICLISIAVPPDFQDGASKTIKGFYDYLKRQGYKVTLLTGKWTNKLNDRDIIQLNFIRKRFFWYPQFVIGVMKYLRTHQFDIIHGNGPKGALPIILSNKKRFITTIHDLGPFETRFTKIPFEKLLIKYVIKKATIVTTVTNFVKKEIGYFIPKSNPLKIINHYNAIEEKFKPYPSEAQKLKQKLNIKGPILLYIGRIAHYKGLDHIIEAYKIVKSRIPDVNLVIGGKPDFRMEKSYFEWKEKYSDIHFVGFISEDDIPYYYSMGDLFITYSYASEGFGLTPIESLACGTPVICSSMLAYKEVLKDNAIFVPPKRPQLLAKEILRLLGDSNLRLKLVQKAQKFIKRYTYTTVGEKIEIIYQEFLKNSTT